MKYLSLSVLSILMVMSSLTSCGLYSFNGVSISPEVKTVSVDFFENRASIIVPSLSQSFTETLRDKFINETNLELVQKNGDLQFLGDITRYSISAIARTGSQTTAQSRLTVTVQVEFVNKKNEKEGWKQSFTKFENYDSNIDLSSVEDQLIETINYQIVEAIFNKAVVNW